MNRPYRGIDPRLVELAVEGATARIQKTLLDLEKTPDDEERQNLEEQLKKEVVSRFSINVEAQSALSDEAFKKFIDQQREDADAYAQKGVIGVPSDDSSSDIFIKLIEGRNNLPPHVIHLINSKDYETFKDISECRVAKIFNPFKDPKNGYFMLPDPSTGELFKKKGFVQFQERVHGDNFNDVLGVLRAYVPEDVLNKLRLQLVRKVQRDAKSWSSYAPATILDENGNPRSIDIKEINQRYVNTFYDAITHAQQYTDCRIDEETIKALKAKRSVLERIVDQLTSPKEVQEGYGRVMDCVPRNIMLRHQLKKITHENVKELIELIKDENVVHVDTRERFGHIAEDYHNIADAYPLRRFSTDHHKYLRNECEYKAQREADDFFGLTRTVRLRDFTLSEYTKRLYETRKTRGNFHRKMRTHRKEIAHFDGKSLDYNASLVSFFKEKHDSEAVETLTLLGAVIDQMSKYKKFTFKAEAR